MPAAEHNASVVLLPKKLEQETVPEKQMHKILTEQLHRREIQSLELLWRSLQQLVQQPLGACASTPERLSVTNQPTTRRLGNSTNIIMTIDADALIKTRKYR
jgi:predicted component of type VI protein secretion system